MIGIINQDGKRVAHRKLDCDLNEVVGFLEPFKPQLQLMAVESTFNWYWLLDGLRAQEYPIDLANADSRHFAGDSTVPRVRNGLDSGGSNASWEPELFGTE